MEAWLLQQVIFAGLGVTTHAKGGNRWVFGAEYLYRKHDYRTVTLPSAQFTAEGGYYLQLLSDAGKTLFFHAGVSALAGYETLNWSERTLYDGARLKNGDAFVYGGALTLEMEVYLSDRIALTASVRERFLWGGSLDRCQLQCGAGFRFYLD